MPPLPGLPQRHLNRALRLRCRLVQTAFFEPKGLPGLIYWYALYPAHAVIFRGMVRALARRAEASGAG